MKNLKILPISLIFEEKNIENWFEKCEFRRLANLFYAIKAKELGELIADMGEVSKSLSFLSYLKTFRTLDYFYVIVKNNKFVGVISFDIAQENLYFKKGKYLIFAQTGLVTQKLEDFWFLMETFKNLTKEIIKKEQPDFAVSYLKNTSHNKRLLKFVEKQFNFKVLIEYNLTYGAFNEN